MVGRTGGEAEFQEMARGFISEGEVYELLNGLVSFF